MLEKYGKSFRDVIQFKSSYLDANSDMLADAIRYAKAYVNQPRRESCKTCGWTLHGDHFIKHGVPYVFCDHCGHLNGCHEDTEEYCKALYTIQGSPTRGGGDYALTYKSDNQDDYMRRVNSIYNPKAQFLFEVLRNEGELIENLNFSDFGAGSGYFIAALLSLGIQSVQGFEVSEAQVNHANQMLGASHVHRVNLNAMTALIRDCKSEVVSFIGVLEHIQDLRGTLAAIKSNSNIKYLYVLVPLFGLSVYNELIFPEVMPRQLSGGHTHLFTQSSLEYIENEYGLSRVGAWWFGTDMMDYYRAVRLKLENKPETYNLSGQFSRFVEELLDGLQLVIDERRKSDQVHLVWRLG